MEPFTRLEAGAAPIDLPNVDTDRIIPARFLKKPRSEGYERFLFHDLRFQADGREDPGFVLNQSRYRDARILVTAENFGCGSSREGAVWALTGRGIRVVIAPSFGDIFFENALRNGLLPVVLPGPVVESLRRALHASPGAVIAVDLARQTVRGPGGVEHRFDIDPFRKESLLDGRDDIGVTLAHGAAIAAFEARSAAETPWVLPGAGTPAP
jgi:3-isopropylmalate/(R)-2-methylmalate dehydratase small subunit